MEYALRDFAAIHEIADNCCVLILVLMEYALRDGYGLPQDSQPYCLNPCSNGICSKRNYERIKNSLYSSLNPCSNGICSKRGLSFTLRNRELCLNPCSNGICSKRTGDIFKLGK